MVTAGAINRKRLLTPLLITVLLIIIIPLTLSAPTYIEFNPNNYFKPTTSGAVSFESGVRADSAYFSGQYIYFTNVMIKNDGYTADIFGARTTTNANLTINHILDSTLNFTVNAPTGNESTTKIRIPSTKTVSDVTGADSWSILGFILTVTVTHSSPAEIIATLSEPAVPVGSGSVPSGDIWLSATETHYPPNYSTTQSGDNDIEDFARGAFVNASLVWENEAWDLYVIESWARVNKSTGDPVPAQMAIYAYVADGDAGALYGNSSERLLNIGPGSTGYTFNYSSPVNVGPNYVFFVLINMDSGGGTNELVYRSHASGKRLDRGGLTFPSWPNPLTGEGTSTGETYHVRAEVRGDNVNNTLFNTYWGTETNYVARRDVNVTFPGGVGSREINFTLPLIERLENITYPVGGVWNSTLTSANYSDYGALNVTHGLYGIPEATIANTGEHLRIFSSTYNYAFTCYGPFYENGTRDNSGLNVSVALASGTDSFFLNGTYVYVTDNETIMFYYSLPGGGSRRFYVDEPTETIYFWYPDNTYSTYEFEIRDFTKKLGLGPAYLETYRVVNSTERIIERMNIIDAVNEVPAVLVIGEVYNLKVLFADDTVYTFGYLVTGVDPTPTIIITDMAFTDQAHTIYDYIQIEATRPTTTSIQLTYVDTTPGYTTTRVNFTVELRNGTSVYNTSTAGSDNIVFNWNAGDNETDYIARAWIDHPYYGEVNRAFLLDFNRIYIGFPSLDMFGDWGFVTTNLFSLFTGIMIMGVFSFRSRRIAPFFGVGSVMVMNRISGGTIGMETQIIALALSLAWAIISGDR